MMNALVRTLIGLGLLREGLDNHVMRASLVVLFLFFRYQKWFDYEAQALIPYISNGPLLFWMYPVFGIRGASWVLGVSEWSDGWAASAGGFPAMTGNVPFLMRDIVLLAASFHLLRQDVAGVAASAPETGLALGRVGLRAAR